jgi:hypothetical protein
MTEFIRYVATVLLCIAVLLTILPLIFISAVAKGLVEVLDAIVSTLCLISSRAADRYRGRDPK